jgi:hypothetical protein
MSFRNEGETKNFPNKSEGNSSPISPLNISLKGVLEVEIKGC